MKLMIRGHYQLVWFRQYIWMNSGVSRWRKRFQLPNSKRGGLATLCYLVLCAIGIIEQLKKHWIGPYNNFELNIRIKYLDVGSATTGEWLPYITDSQSCKMFEHFISAEKIMKQWSFMESIYHCVRCHWLPFHLTN